jgi:hypothetical protein
MRPRPRRLGEMPTRLTGAPSPALARSWGGLVVYGRFLHCPLFRAICDAWAAKVGPRQKSRPGQPYADRTAVFMRFTLGIPRRARRPSRRAAPAMRATAMSESKASWTARRALALSGGSAAPAGKAADFVGKLTAQVSHVRLLAIRRPGDPPPIGNAPSWKALLRWCSPWIGPVRHHGHVAPPFACLPWRRGPRPAS